MSLKKTHKTEPAQLESAKDLYLAYTTISDIAKSTGMSRSSIMYYIPKWREEREQIKSEVINALVDSKRDLMYTIAKSGLEVLQRSMVDLAKSKRVLTPKEMTGIAAIIDNLDKISKLDEGKATEIIREARPATVVEMRKLLANDPFLEITNEEITVIDEPVSKS